MSFKSVLFASIAALALVGSAVSPAVADEPENRLLDNETTSDGTPLPPPGSELVESGTWQMGPWLPGDEERVLTGYYEGVATYLYAYVGQEYNGQYIGLSLFNKYGQITDCIPTQVWNGAAHYWSLSGDGYQYVSRFGICHSGFEGAPLYYEVYNKVR